LAKIGTIIYPKRDLFETQCRRALLERKPPPTLCHFFRCVRQVAALYSAEACPIWQ